MSWDSPGGGGGGTELPEQMGVSRAPGCVVVWFSPVRTLYVAKSLLSALGPPIRQDSTVRGVRCCIWCSSEVMDFMGIRCDVTDSYVVTPA